MLTGKKRVFELVQTYSSGLGRGSFNVFSSGMYRLSPRMEINESAIASWNSVLQWLSKDRMIG